MFRYASAERVIIWLGGDDECTADGTVENIKEILVLESLTGHGGDER
jgi:hypothetical protein